MKENNHKRLGDVIKKLMKNPKLAGRLDDLDAIEIWQDLIGSSLCNYIANQRISKRVLHVKLNSAVVRDELSYRKSLLIKQINQRLGKNYITDIYLK